MMFNIISVVHRKDRSCEVKGDIFLWIRCLSVLMVEQGYYALALCCSQKKISKFWGSIFLKLLILYKRKNFDRIIFHIQQINRFIFPCPQFPHLAIQPTLGLNKDTDQDGHNVWKFFCNFSSRMSGLGGSWFHSLPRNPLTSFRTFSNLNVYPVMN